VVHVGMREEHGVELRQLPLPEGGLDQAPRSQLGEASSQADAALEHRIGEDPGTVKVQQDRRVAQPRGRKAVVRPGRRVRPVRRGRDAAPEILSAVGYCHPRVPPGERKFFGERQVLSPKLAFVPILHHGGTEVTERTEKNNKNNSAVPLCTSVSSAPPW